MADASNFFDNIGTGSGAPGALLKNVGDYVHGEIVDAYERDYVPFGKTEPEKRPDGTNKQQLVIVIQTQFRNWANVSKVPTVDHADPNSAPKPPEEDDGKRAVYVPEGKNIQFAIGRAVAAAKAKFEVGGTLGVKIFNLKPTDKGNPLKEHEAVYQPPSAAGGFFNGAQQGAQAPAQQAPLAQGSSFGGGDRGLNPEPAQQAPASQQQAAPAAQGDPWASQAPAQPIGNPPPAGDPWATPSAPSGNQPPF